MPKPRLSQRKPERTDFARQQRQTANEFSRDEWELVRGRRLLGEKFRREHPVGSFTLDFVCLELMLDLEVDGKDHLTDEGKLRDARRDQYLTSLGFEVLRINGFRVTQDARKVRDEIEAVVRRLRMEGPSPPAPKKGRGEPV